MKILFVVAVANNVAKMNNIVYLITTYKCSACKCMKYILLDVIEELKDKIKLEFIEIDCQEVPDWLKTNIRFTDFPCTVLIKNYVIKLDFVGTKSAKKVKQIIEDVFS